MPLARPARAATLIAASALCVTTLASAPPASASPVFADAYTELNPFGGYYTGSGTCTATGTTADNIPSVPVVENGAPASVTSSSSATFGNSAVPGDTGTWTSQASATGAVTSAGGNPRTLDFSVTSTYTLANASATCERGGYAGADLFFRFAVTTGGFLHVDFRQSGGEGYGEVYLNRVTTDAPYIEYETQRAGVRADQTVYLPPGTYTGYFDGGSSVDPRLTSASGTVTTRMHAVFNVAGAQASAVVGAAKKYVALPGSRSCATGSLQPAVTTSKKAASKIRQVAYLVDGALVRKVRTPKKGSVATLPLAADRSADVSAVVILEPRRKGARPKVLEVSTSYEACS